MQLDAFGERVTVDCLLQPKGLDLLQFNGLFFPETGGRLNKRCLNGFFTTSKISKLVIFDNTPNRS